MSPPIGQALPGDAFERVVCTLRVSHAKRRAIVVAEVELSHILLQVLFAYVVIRPDQAALQDIEEGFRRVRMNVVAHVFLPAMHYRFVAGEFAAYLVIDVAFIGH